MTTATLEPAAKPWECWECTALPQEHPDRKDCICKVHRPTHAIALLLEPLPTDLRVQASMLSAKLRMGREQVRGARENAKFEERYDPIEAEKLREDALRWQLRVDRIEAELRRVQAALNAAAGPSTAGAAPAKPTASGVRAPRKAARAPRTRAGKPAKGAAKKGAASKSGPPGSTDGPGSGDPPPSDPDPERPAPTAGQGTVAERRPLLERTRDFWQRRTSRRLSLEDAREIMENSVGFIRLLNTWATKKAGKKPADPSTLPGGTDGTGDGTVTSVP